MQNEKAEDENKGQSITDAMITEMEAEIYGLQVCTCWKNHRF